MSLATEVFGEEVLRDSFAEFKEKVKTVPTDLREKKAYLLKDFAAIKGIKLTQKDYDEVGVGLFK